MSDAESVSSQPPPPSRKRPRGASAPGPPAPASQPAAAVHASKTVFVGHLPFAATKEQLSQLFEDNGIKPASVRLLTKRGTTESRGTRVAGWPRTGCCWRT